MSKSVTKRYEAALKKHGSQRQAAIALGIPRSTLQLMLKRESEPVFQAVKPKKPVLIRPPKRNTKRFIFTAAQNNTLVHEGFLENLKAYADHLDAPLHIATFTYNKRLFEENRKDDPKQWFHPSIVPYLTNDQFDIAENLVFCGNMNTLPTAVSPLSGFETYTRSKWGIFPHAKVQLVSVPTMKHNPAKQIMTTGAVTLPNYVQKRAGIRAHFHHVLGAVLVEIDSEGDQFCRHLLGESDTGAFQDLTSYVSGGKVTDGHRVEAITWGDIHLEQIDATVAIASLGWDPCVGNVAPSRLRGPSMLEWFKPRYQFFEDTWDFHARNHHSIHDPHFRYEMAYKGRESVEESCDEIARFLSDTRRDWCRSVVVESNHDVAALRWLKEADWKNDPINAKFYLRAQLAALEAIENSEKFSVLEWALRETHPESAEDVIFLREDDSFTICNDEIECAIHGHLGSNGAKGSPKQFTKMGPKGNTGHTHSPGIIDGIYTSGTMSRLDMGYNRGLSSWAHADIVTYPNAKRTIITKQNGKYCAE